SRLQSTVFAAPRPRFCAGDDASPGRAASIPFPAFFEDFASVTVRRLQQRTAGGDTMNAMTLLRQQHKQVRDLFKKVEKTEDPDERRSLLDRIAGELAMHTKIEEEIFYPAVRGLGTEKAEEMIREALEEHHVVDLVLAELPEVDPEDE